jgi:hypothetical protein
MGDQQQTRCRLGRRKQRRTVDGQLVARTVAELRAMSEAEDLLARLGRVVEATRTVVGVDGTGLTMTSEDGQPR